MPDEEEGGATGGGRENAEDILEEVLELIITDFDHAEDERLKGHDIHAETHQHEHEDGGPAS